MKAYIFFILILFSIQAWAQLHNHSSKAHDHQLSLELDLALAANHELFLALLGTDQLKVEAAGKRLIERLQRSNSKLKKLSLNINPFKGTNNKEQNLEQYSKFLPGLIEIFKQNKINQNYALFYCPMVKKHWIQNVKKVSRVQNVFAQDMLECGEKLN